jgi:hypothetical protein
MLITAAEQSADWPEAAIVIAGIALVGGVLIVAVWQALATARARMTGAHEAELRALADEVRAAQARTATALEALRDELRAQREEER